MLFMVRCVKCDRPVESRKPRGCGHSVERICESCATDVLASLGFGIEKQPDGTSKVVHCQLELALVG